MRNELIIGGYSIDMIENLGINITKEIYSIMDPSKRKADYTKTVEIPRSKNNDNIFASLFDVNFAIRDSAQLNPDFNPAKKASCIYLQDTFQQIKGYCQLTEIVKSRRSGKVVYQVVIYGKVRDLFSDIANLTLNDLTTLGTAVWNDAAIIASWTDTFEPTIKPCYPFISRGKTAWNRFNLFPEWSVNYEAFKPWMYVKHIVNAIIHEADYSQEVASFFETQQFRRLIVECDVKKFQQNDTAIQNTQVATHRNATQTITPVSNANAANLSAIWDKQIIWNIEDSDPSSQYDNTTGTITIGANSAGYGNLEVKFSGTANKTGSATGSLHFVIMLKRGSTYSRLRLDRSNRNPQVFSSTTSISYDLAVDSYQFQVGDEIRVCLQNFTVGATPNNALITNFVVDSSNNYCNFYIDGQINYGQTFDIAAILPNMKQTDFLMGILKWCNAYVDTSDGLDRGLVIEPRDRYYTNEVIDWTDKLDTNKEFKIIPQGLLENKEILFSFTGNDDDNSKGFKQAVGYEFGYKRLLFDNDFVKDKKELKLPFSICPLVNDTDFGIIAMATRFNGTPAEKSTAPILAYYGNMKAGRMVYWDTTGARTVYTSYPYAGPLDDPNTPSYDLAFGIQDIYFHAVKGANGTYIAAENAYSQFHEPQWQEVGHRDSKLVHAYFKLDPDDIATLSFRPKYWVENAEYRLLQVENYDPQNKDTTLCKLLKLTTYSAATPSPVLKPGGPRQGGSTDVGDIFKQIKDGKFKAPGNEIDTNVGGAVVTGYGNKVGSGSKDIIVHGENNEIPPGTSKVALINTDNKVIRDGDLAYISNLEYKTGQFSFDAADLTAVGIATALVQEKHLYPGNSVAFDGANTAGNLIVVFYSGWNPSGSYSCNDSNGNSYTQFEFREDGSSFSVIVGWYAYNITGGGTNTVTVSGIDNDEGLHIYEFSGIEDGSDPHQDSDGADGDTDPLQVSLTLADVCLIVAGWHNAAGDDYVGPIAGFSQLHHEPTHSDAQVVRHNTPAGSQNAGVEIGGADESNVLIAAAFKAGAAQATHLLLEAPGDGRAIDVMDVYGRLTYGTTPYSLVKMQIINESLEVLHEFPVTFISSGSDIFMKATRINYQLRPDENIYLTSNGLLGSGDGDLELTVSYRRI